MARVLERTTATHCSCGLLAMNFRLLDHLAGSFHRFQALFREKKPPKQSVVLIKQFCRTMFRPLSTRMLETVKNIASALNGVQRSVSELHLGTVGAPVLKKWKCAEDCKGSLVRCVLFL